jgi:peptidyl-prolyl cis-trans isomerase C
MTAKTARSARAAALALAALFAPALATAAEADRVLATVNGTEITLGHVAVLREALPQQYQALPDDVLFKGILEQLIQQTALAQSAEAALGPRDRIGIENERRAYVSGVALRAVVGAAVTDEALQAAYMARYAAAEPGTEYNAAHILVATEAEAEALKAQLADGADFADLARQHSTDAGSGARGGDLGWFGTGMMVPAFEAAVVGATPGTVAGPVETQFGWHLVLVRETRLAEVPPLDAVRDELAAEIEQAAVEAHIAAVTEAATITRSDEGIDPATMRDQTLFAD